MHRDELWGVRLSLDFIFFPVEEITRGLRAADFDIEEVIEREPYPDVEYQSQRAYVFARRKRSNGTSPRLQDVAAGRRQPQAAGHGE